MEKYGFKDYIGIGDVIGHTLGAYYSNQMVAAQTVRWFRLEAKELKEKSQPWFLAKNDIELFDLEKDPEERHNLAKDLDKPEVRNLPLTMNHKLNQAIEEEVGVDDNRFLPDLKRFRETSDFKKIIW